MSEYHPSTEMLHRVIDAWESLPGGQQVRNSDVEKWLNGKMAKAINEARQLLGRPKPGEAG